MCCDSQGTQITFASVNMFLRERTVDSPRLFKINRFMLSACSVSHTTYESPHRHRRRDCTRRSILMNCRRAVVVVLVCLHSLAVLLGSRPLQAGGVRSWTIALEAGAVHRWTVRQLSSTGGLRLRGGGRDGIRVSGQPGGEKPRGTTGETIEDVMDRRERIQDFRRCLFCGSSCDAYSIYLQTC